MTPTDSIDPRRSSLRVLVLAPRGCDSAVILDALAQVGLIGQDCPNMEAICRALEEGAGALLITEEALTLRARRSLIDCLQNQPRWSVLPILVLGLPGQGPRMLEDFLSALGPAGTATVVERPIKPATLQHVVQMALLSRERQYQIRDHLAELEEQGYRLRQSEAELVRHREHLQQLVDERTAELEQASQRLRISERLASLGTLAAGLGHDMGNLLVPVRVRLETLATLDLPPEATAELAGIRSSADYLQKLASGLRLLAIDPSRAAPSESTELGEWWLEAGLLLRNAVPRAIALKADLPEGPCRVAMARAPLTQAIFNLVQNAGDAMRAEAQAEVVIGARVVNDAVEVRVKDSGPGMTEEVRRRCMEPFFSTKTRGVSTGLGLALVYGLVTAAGGTIEVDSQPGRGTTFTLRLPRAPDPAPTQNHAPRRRAVLDVRDSRLRGFITRELESLAFDVLHTGTDDGSSDLLVTDRDDAPEHRNGRCLKLNGTPPKMLELRETLRKLAAPGAAKETVP